MLEDDACEGFEGERAQAGVPVSAEVLQEWQLLVVSSLVGPTGAGIWYYKVETCTS